MTILMQISANTGPEECCLGAVKLIAHLEAQARACKIGITLVEEVRVGASSLLQSAVLALEGDEAACRLFAEPYVGTILWVCPSPLRPQHRRKNWYLDVMLFSEPARDFGNEVRFETMRSSGPGGQHANKTETAVRATHVGTGLSVKIEVRAARAPTRLPHWRCSAPRCGNTSTRRARRAGRSAGCGTVPGPAMLSSSALSAAIFWSASGDAQAPLRRRRKPKPNRPDASSAMEPGSGRSADTPLSTCLISTGLKSAVM